MCSVRTVHVTICNYLVPKIYDPDASKHLTQAGTHGTIYWPFCSEVNCNDKSATLCIVYTHYIRTPTVRSNVFRSDEHTALSHDIVKGGSRAISGQTVYTQFCIFFLCAR